jgi:hypothetical protein
MSAALLQESGQAQFPNIYIGEEHLGSFDDLKSYVQCGMSLSTTLLANGIQIGNPDALDNI